MAGKHQIWSSNKKTRQRANRCWRRQGKVRLAAESHDAPESKPGEHGGDPKSGDLVHADELHFGTSLGELLDAVAHIPEECPVDLDQFLMLVRKWHGCSLEDFRQLRNDLPDELILECYQMFQVDPLEQFLDLPREQQVRMLSWLSK